MGNCCTSCLPTCRNNGNSFSFRMLSPHHRNDFSTFLAEEKGTDSPKQRSFLSQLFSKRRNPQKMGPTGIMDGLLKPQLSYHRLESQRVSPKSSCIRKDIQLQCLDARALLGRSSVSTRASTPENSLDLEWEHETLPCSLIHDPSASSWATSTFPEDTLTQNRSLFHVANGLNTTDSECSRVSSSANSLEWDSVQNSIHSEGGDTLDTDTQFLLNEIDRLTMQALKETGNAVEHVGYLDDAL